MSSTSESSSPQHNLPHKIVALNDLRVESLMGHAFGVRKIKDSFSWVSEHFMRGMPDWFELAIGMKRGRTDDGDLPFAADAESERLRVAVPTHAKRISNKSQSGRSRPGKPLDGPHWCLLPEHERDCLKITNRCFFNTAGRHAWERHDLTCLSLPHSYLSQSHGLRLQVLRHRSFQYSRNMCFASTIGRTS